MARVVVKTEKKPFVLAPQDKPAYICMCGLSKNPPFCDKSHLAVQDEKDDELYEYDKDGKRTAFVSEEDEHGGCCGGGCCGGKHENHDH